MNDIQNEMSLDHRYFYTFNDIAIIVWNLPFLAAACNLSVPKITINSLTRHFYNISNSQVRCIEQIILELAFIFYEIRSLSIAATPNYHLFEIKAIIAYYSTIKESKESEAAQNINVYLDFRNNYVYLGILS